MTTKKLPLLHFALFLFSLCFTPNQSTPSFPTSTSEKVVSATATLCCSVVAGYFLQKTYLKYLARKTHTTPHTTFADIPGAHETKATLLKASRFLKDPDTFTAIGADPTRSILVSGDYKHYQYQLAQAVAHEAGCNLYTLDASLLTHNSYIRPYKQFIHKLFQQASQQSPAIIVINNLQKLVTADKKPHKALYEIVKQIHKYSRCLDTPILVIGITHAYVSTLTPFFQDTITIPSPTLQERKELLQSYLTKYPCAQHIDVTRVALSLGSISAAQVKKLVASAAISAAENGKTHLDTHTLLLEVEKLYFDPEITHATRSNYEQKCTAYHEAGHTLLRILLPNSLYYLSRTTIQASKNNGGKTTHFRKQLAVPLLTLQSLLDEITIALGGKAAEEIIFNMTSTGPRADLKRARKFAEIIVCSGMSACGLTPHEPDRYGDLTCSPDMKKQLEQEIENILQQQYQQALELLKLHKEKLDLLAHALLEKGTIWAEEAYELLDIPQPSYDESGF